MHLSLENLTYQLIVFACNSADDVEDWEKSRTFFLDLTNKRVLPIRQPFSCLYMGKQSKKSWSVYPISYFSFIEHVQFPRSPFQSPITWYFCLVYPLTQQTIYLQIYQTIQKHVFRCLSASTLPHLEFPNTAQHILVAPKCYRVTVHSLRAIPISSRRDNFPNIAALHSRPHTLRTLLAVVRRGS